VFYGGSVVFPEQVEREVIVQCANGLIEWISPAQQPAQDAELIDLADGYLIPGLVDIHVHGGDGADFMDGTAQAVRQACAAHLRHGTTTIFPTTTTGSPEQIHAMLDACIQVAGEKVGPNLAGVHLYGPFFAEDKVGCHSANGRRSPTAEEYQSYFASGIVKIATCAAELDGAADFYRTAAAHRCLITCGHSNASWGEMQSAFELGMRHVDHFWCAMSSVPSLRQRLGVPMQASMAEFVLMQSAMSTEVIADGYHLAPELLEFAFRMLTSKRLCLVTDCNRALDMPPGEYFFGHSQGGSRLRSDGRVGWSSDGTSLASSVVGMDHMLRHMHRSTTASLAEVVRMGSLTPAERVGIDQQTGSIAAGKRADLVVLDQHLNVQRVYVGGQERYRRAAADANNRTIESR
jgi:N-acetylglucosamine-6-phosphate deacetylase